MPSRTWISVAAVRDAWEFVSTYARPDYVALLTDGRIANPAALPGLQRLLMLAGSDTDLYARLALPANTTERLTQFAYQSSWRQALVPFLAFYFSKAEGIRYVDEAFDLAMDEVQRTYIFASSTMRIIWPLGNIKLETDEIQLGKDLYIRMLDRSDIEAWINPASTWVERPLPQYLYADFQCALEHRAFAGTATVPEDGRSWRRLEQALAVVRLVAGAPVCPAFTELSYPRLVWERGINEYAAFSPHSSRSVSCRQ